MFAALSFRYARLTYFSYRIKRLASISSVSDPKILKELRNYCRDGQFENVLQSLQKLTKSGILPDENVISVAIQSLIDSNEVEKAENVLNFCNKNEIKITNKMLNILAHGQSRVGNYNRVNELIGMKQASQHSSSRLDSVARLTGYCKGGDIDNAKLMFDDILTQPAKNLSMNIIYTTMMTGYLNVNDAKSAIELFESFVSKKVSSPDILMYNTLIGAYGEIGDCRSARSVFHRLVSDKLQPSIKTWNKLLRAYSNAGEWRSVQHMASLIKSSKSVSRLSTAQPGDGNDSLYNILRRWPVEADDVTFNICLQSLACHTDRRDQVMGNLNWCMSRKLLISASTQMKIACMFARMGMMNDVMDIISRFSASNPDVTAYALVCALVGSGREDTTMMMKIALELCQPSDAIAALDKHHDEQSKQLLISHFDNNKSA